MTPENLFLEIPAALTCLSAVSVSEHMYWSYVPQLSLLQLVDWVYPIPFLFLINDSIYDKTLGLE